MESRFLGEKELNQWEFDPEDLVNRFAAELLFPERIFKKEVHEKLNEYDYKGPRMSAEIMVRLVTYLMNYFCIPYKAIIRRFIELGCVEERRSLYMAGKRGYIYFISDDADARTLAKNFFQ